MLAPAVLPYDHVLTTHSLCTHCVLTAHSLCTHYVLTLRIIGLGSLTKTASASQAQTLKPKERSSW